MALTIVSVAVFEDSIYVVDSVGAAWRLDPNQRWHKLPDLPQPPAPAATTTAAPAASTTAAPAASTSTPSSA